MSPKSCCSTVALTPFWALCCAIVVSGCGADGMAEPDEEGPGISAQALGVGDFVSIQSYNIPDMYIRHRDLLGELTTVSSSLDRADATFRVVTGLANRGCVSFEASNISGSYLRHQDLRLKLHPFVDESLFKDDATFCIRSPLQPGVGAPWLSLESYNLPGYYIRHADLHVWVGREGGPFQADATFRFVEPL